MSLILAKYRLAFTLIPRGFPEYGQDIPRHLYFQSIWVNSRQIYQYHYILFGFVNVYRRRGTP